MRIMCYSQEIFKVMRRRFVSLFFLVCGLTSCLKNTKEISVLTIEKSDLERAITTGVLWYGSKPFSGKAQRFYSNCVLAEETYYRKGIKHGKMTKWFPDGSLAFSANYNNNLREGEVKSWWNNGRLRSFSNYNKGKAEGIQMEWYKSGQLFKKLQLTKGIEKGMQQAWRENGKLFNNYEAKNGRIFGLKRANLCFELKNEQISSN